MSSDSVSAIIREREQMMEDIRNDPQMQRAGQLGPYPGYGDGPTIKEGTMSDMFEQICDDHAAKAELRTEILKLRGLLREAHDVLDADGHQVLATRIHRALEGDR